MDTCKEGDTYLLLQDLQYKDNDDDKNDVVSKNKLDLFLPKNHSAQTPVVVFVHGGGWLRGDRRAFKHYFSYYDTNLLVALAMAYYDAYWNVGKALASNGVACAVVSYRLSRLEFPWLIIELCCSLMMSVVLISTPLLLLMMLAYCVSLIFSTDIVSDIGISRFINIPLLVILSMVIIWIIVCLNERYFIAPREKIWPLSTLFITCIFFMLFDVNALCIALCSMVCLGICLLYSFATIQQKCRPIVKHPSHICDVALSIKWIKDFAVTHKVFDFNRIFLCGHSAGGHLVSLLALNSSYLELVGLSLSDIKGIISISGVYNLHSLSGGLLEYLFLRPAFGNNKQLWTSTSPLHQLPNQKHSFKNHQHHNASNNCSSFRNQPKISFLVINAEHDPLLTQDAQDFVARLVQQNYPCQYLVIPNVNHLSVILSFGRTSGQSGSVEQHCLTFVNSIT